MKHRILLLTFFVVWLTGLSVFGQAIETEFREEAAVQWRELRTATVNSSAFVVDTTIKEISLDADSKKPHTRIMDDRRIQFTKLDFKYSESIPLSDTDSPVKVPFNRRHVHIYNSEQAFSISKDPGSEWVLIDVEEASDDRVLAEDSISANGHDGNKKGPDSALTALKYALGQDPRLMTGRTLTVEKLVSVYLRYDENSFSDFSVSDDKDFGRIVTAKLSYKVDLNDRPQRRPTKAVKLTVEGEFKFLADWSWLPVSIQTIHREFDKDGNQLRKTTKTVTSDYDPKQIEEARRKAKDLMPRNLTISSKSEPHRKNREFSITYAIRSLTTEEIESINKKRLLSDFELKK